MKGDLKEREKFSSGLAVFLATLSSAVGLGNIWMFPYITGQNGGAAFIFVYFACVLLIGLPVLLGEFVIGRETKKNVYGAIKSLTNKKFFRLIGILGIIGTAFILFFYTVVAGWVYSYVFKAIGGTFTGLNAEEVANVFRETSTGVISPLFWQFIAVAVACGIIMFGVKGGIEKLTKVLMPVLIVLLVFCMGRSLLLPGAKEGIEFLLKPDFSKINIAVILSALGLAFFKLCIGTGTMITYSSYYTEDNNMPATGLKVALADTGVSLLAGLAIFPAVFSFGLEPTSGPGLLFETIPLIFSGLPGGNLLTIIFFLLTAMAATMAMISLFEVLTAALTEELKLNRKVAQIVNLIGIMGFGSLAALSGHPEGVLSNIKLFGFTFFDFYDKATSLFILPINGLLVAILVGYFINKKIIVKQITNSGLIKNEKLCSILIFNLKYIAPILILIVFIGAFI
ncbi:MAG: sodium-dependent transporter [Sarcina sp.]